ncbi:MAG: hypothetical protein PHG24_01015 [Candidatus Pacebacteria bacterium]|nr:hypothetical protein [Candidatus Paceibacterota bacterium]
MIQGVFIFLIILFAYSFWWFDFYFFKNNINIFEKEFKKLVSKSDVVLIFNSGGWGTIDYKKANDLNPFSKCIKDYLKKKNLKVSIVQYFRTEDHIIGKLGYLKDYASAFEKQSKAIANIISKTNKKVVLLGLSNGALMADEIMDRVKRKNNIFSIELGKPFFGVHSNNKNILLINDFKDDLSNGKTIELLKTVFIYAPLKWIKSFFLGEKIPFGKMVEVKGHYYPIERHEKRVINFINKKII